MVQSHASQLTKLDLNLLIVLHALYETRSTTQAALLIGRTQPAISLALGRLRDSFQDQLFVRSGQGLEPTPMAIELEIAVRQIMSDAVRLFERRTQFDPALASNELTLAFPENALEHAHILNSEIQKNAPQMTVHIKTLTLGQADYDWGVNALISGEIDLLLSFYRSEAPKGIELLKLGTQNWMTIHYSESGKPLTMQEWLERKHVIVTSGKTGRSPIGDLLAARGMERTIGLRTSSFAQALYTVRNSDMILNTMSPVVDPMAKALDLTLSEPPIELPPVSMGLMLRDTRLDPLSKWLATLSHKLFQAENR